MARVINFSRQFPSYHPKVGRPTYFVEQILRGLGINYRSDSYIQKLCVLNTKNIANGKLSFEDIESFALSLQEKNNSKVHTMRSGSRFKSGDTFSPRCWFGRPYNSPQLIFWDDIEVIKTWKFENDIEEGGFYMNGKLVDDISIIPIAENDGLSCEDFLDWFPVGNEINGQIICWDEYVKY